MGLLNAMLWGVPTFFTVLFTFILYNLHSHKTFFKKHNIPYMGSGFIRFLKLIFGKISLVQAERETYEEAVKCQAPIVGFTNLFSGSRGLYLVDMETMKNVCVKDFDHFVNRPNFPGGDKNFYLAKMLFALESEQWKGVRSKMSPMFTTGKIKRMFEILRRSSENMKIYLDKNIGQQMELDFSPIFIKYTMDTIAGTAFAIDSKAWEGPLGETSKFEDMGNRWQISFSGGNILKFLLMFCAPKLFDLLKLELLDSKAEQYFVDIVKHVVKQRRQSGDRNEDFLQLMWDLQAGILKTDEMDATFQVMNGDVSGKITFDDDDIVANALLFLSGGFDTTHSVLCFVIYSLTLNAKVQEKLWREVDSKMSLNGGKLAYEDLLEMGYLDMVVNESLRMYSPNPRTERICTKDYLVPGTNFTIEKGSYIAIPMYPSQFDERYFPNPEKFIPERFTNENKATRSPYAFMPFGHGPRGCIAMRFALIMVKAAIAQLVYSFQFSPSPKTKIPMEYDQTVSLKPKGGLWLNVTSRK